MTVLELVEMARLPGQDPDPRVADGVIDLLAEVDPCGLEAVVVYNGVVSIPDSWAAAVTPEDARAMARMLLRAADLAENAVKP